MTEFRPTCCEDFIKDVLTEYIEEGNIEMIQHTWKLMKEKGYAIQIIKKED